MFFSSWWNILGWSLVFRWRDLCQRRRGSLPTARICPTRPCSTSPLSRRRSSGPSPPKSTSLADPSNGTRKRNGRRFSEPNLFVANRNMNLPDLFNLMLKMDRCFKFYSAELKADGYLLKLFHDVDAVLTSSFSLARWSNLLLLSCEKILENF